MSKSKNKVALLEHSNNPKKRYMIFYNDKKIYFGSPSYENYTIHQDDKRKKSYIKRHEAREDWSKAGITTPGFWSRWLLWNKKTIDESIGSIWGRFGVYVVNLL
jgi:hypothetical protein